MRAVDRLLARLNSPPSKSSIGSETPFSDLLRQSRGGCRDSLGELAGRFYPRVETLVHARLQRDLRRSRPWLSARFSTGDVVHEVFNDILTDVRGFRGATPDAFAGYLSILVRNRIVDAIRHHEAAQRDARRGTPESRAYGEASVAQGPAESAAINEERGRFQEALAALSDRDRMLVRARAEELATFAELAEQLGYETESGVRRAFYAARARLAMHLSRR